jgi:hypothetical protein
VQLVGQQGFSEAALVLHDVVVSEGTADQGAHGVVVTSEWTMPHCRRKAVCSPNLVQVVSWSGREVMIGDDQS